MYVTAYTLEKISFSFTGPKGCIPIEKMRETNHAVRLEPHLIPTTAEAVRMYEERDGRLNTDPSIGYDPIACYVFDLQFQQIIHTVSFRCLTFISPDLKRFQHETSTTLTATTNSSSHENTLVQRAHARFPLARGGYNNSRQCQSHFRSPTETPVSGLLLETNNKTIKLKCSAFDILHLATCGSKLRLSL